MPALIINASDDRLIPFSPTTYIAGPIEGAEMLTFDTGGHLLPAQHDAARWRIAVFLANYARTGGE